MSYGLGAVPGVSPTPLIDYADGRYLYSRYDSAAAALVASVTANWEAYKAGTIVGGEFDRFEEAAGLGYVADTPRGYDLCLGQGFLPKGLPDSIQISPTFPAFWLAWTWAKVQVPADQAASNWLATTASWPVSDAKRAIANAAFLAFYPYYQAQFGGTAQPIGYVQTVPNPVTGVATPLSDVLYYGPLPGVEGYTAFATASGAWTVAGTYTGTVIGAPTQNVLDAAAAILGNVVPAPEVPKIVLGQRVEAVVAPSIDPALWIMIASRTWTDFTDGTSAAGPWHAEGGRNLSREFVASAYFQVWTWDQLEAVDQQAILAAGGQVPVTSPLPGAEDTAPEVPPPPLIDPGIVEEDPPVWIDDTVASDPLPGQMDPGTGDVIPLDELPPDVVTTTTPPQQAGTGLLLGLGLLGALLLGKRRRR